MVEITNPLADAAPVFPVRLRSRPFDLPRNALFSKLSREQQRLLLPKIKKRRIKANRAFLEEGARNPGKIYIVVDGQVSVTKQTYSPFDARTVELEVSVLRRGDLCGEVSFVDGRPSAVTFVAKTDVTVAVVDLSAAHRNQTVRRLKTIVATKLQSHLSSKAGDAVEFQINTLRMENELAQYRSGVGHLVITTLCLLSFYTLMLSFLPNFTSLAHANFALSPLIILMFALSFVPVIATSGFPRSFFGLHTDNWKPALIFSMKVSAIFLVGFLFCKWLLIHSSSSFNGLPLIEGAQVEVDGREVPLSGWYWVAVVVYLILTPMQEFVARSGIQAPLYAFLQGSETKRRTWSIVASNLVFAAAHAHISVAFAMAAFLPGLLWGWIFARTNSLLASTASHIVVGGVAIFCFGIETVVSRL